MHVATMVIQVIGYRQLFYKYYHPCITIIVSDFSNGEKSLITHDNFKILNADLKCILSKLLNICNFKDEE